MKALLRIFFVFLGLLTILVLSAYYVVSLPKFQKKLIEDRLPKGSSIHAVQITKESIELTDLSLSLPNGTVVQIGSIHSRFSIWSALFERTIFLRKIKLDELNIKLPDSEPSLQPYFNSQESRSKNLSSIYFTLSRVLRFVEKGDWRFDVDPTQVSGVLTDATGNSHIFNLTATEVALGTETIVRANLDFGSKKTIQDGLKNYDLIINLVFAQKKEGGFHQIRLESLIECASASDDILLSFAHDLNLSLKSSGEIININFSFDSKIPYPEVFVPELTGIRDLSIKGDVKATFGGDTLILNAADVDIRMQDVAIATLKLKQSLKLNTRQSLVGELIKIDLVDFPLDLIGPCFGSGLQISGTPISTEVVIVGKSTGVLQLSALKPLQVGPFFMNKGKKMLLEEVIIRLNPFFDLDNEGVVRYDSGDIQILDRYGQIIQGRISGSKRFTSSNPLFSDSQADAQLKLGLSELFQQPVLAETTNVMAGQAKLVFKINSKKKYPIKLQANITGLRAGNISGLPKECSLFSQLKKNENGEYISESEFSFGSKDAPSSNVQITAQAMPSHKAIPFKFSLSAPKVSQTDIDFLFSALKPQEKFSRNNLPSRNTKTSKQNSKIPYWANLYGEAIIKLDQFIMSSGNTVNGISLKVTISEPSSSINQIDASVKSSALSGKAKVTYNFKDTSAYQTSSSLSFNNIDPSIFSNKSSKSLPVKGSFDGSFNLNGKGVDLKASLENAQCDLTITSRDGILTAFELDERSKLGLLGASILGQSLNRPGITAMSLATPYFKNIHFDSFALKLDKPEDKTINISQLLIQGDNLRINGNGSIAATKLNELIKKPLMLTLEFGARGRLIDYLETLGLLTPIMDTNGFRTLNKSITIGGTLSNPDTSVINQVLNHAASRALEQPSTRKLAPKSDEIPTIYRQESIEHFKDKKNKGKTKEEKILDDIESGLEILNSIFG